MMEQQLTSLGRVVIEGLKDGCDIGSRVGWPLDSVETEGFREGSPLPELGFVDGWPDGSELGSDKDVGQSETEGFSDGTLLGGVVMVGDCEGIDDGSSDKLLDGWPKG